jgi:hypothetical protein
VLILLLKTQTILTEKESNVPYKICNRYLEGLGNRKSIETRGYLIGTKGSSPEYKSDFQVF